MSSRQLSEFAAMARLILTIDILQYACNTRYMQYAERVRLRDIAAGYLRIGSTSFGMAMMPQIRALVTNRGWLTQDEFRDGAALVQVYPGPYIVDLAAYTGYKVRGVLGAMVATSSLIFPAFVSIVGLSALYFELGAMPIVQRFLVGL